MNEKQKRRRLLGLVIPVVSGKTKLCNELVNFHHDKIKYSFVDIDEFATLLYKDKVELFKLDQTKELTIFPELRQHINELLTSYSQSAIVIVTSNPRFINFLGIKRKRISVFMPTQEFNHQTMIDSLNLHNDELIFKSRERIITEYGNTIIYYKSWKELEDYVVRRFQLVRRS